MSTSTSTIRKRKANNGAVQFEDNPGLSVPLNFDLSVSPEFGLLDWFIEKVIAYSEPDTHTVRPSTVEKLNEAVNILLANLLSAYRVSPQCFVRISRSPNSYASKGNRYQDRSISFDCLMTVIDYMADGNSPLVAFVNGFKDERPIRDEFGRKKKRRGNGKLSRIKATGDLLAIVVKHLESRIRGGIVDPVSFSDLPPITTRISIPGEMIVSSATSDVIELRAAKEKRDAPPERMKYKDDDETKRMRSNVIRWNAFAERHWLDLFLPDEQLEHLYQDHALEKPADDRFFFKKKDRSQFVELNRVRLSRIFNNGSFDEGGRFYGGWWQDVPKEYRKYITINGSPTNEVDYVTIHPAMLYAQEGLPLTEDSYSIPGLEKYRDNFVKPAFNALINAKNKKIRPPEELPEGWTWPDVQAAIIEKHELLKDHFYSGIGLQLQRKDADIAEDVMMRMMDFGHLVLPIHDSFLVVDSETETLKKTMTAVYRKHMNAEIQLKVKLSFTNEVLVCSYDDGATYPGPQEILDDLLESEPGYDGYRERKAEFEKSRVIKPGLPGVTAPSLVPDNGKSSHRDIIATPLPEKPGMFEASWNGKPLVESRQPFLDSARRLLEMGADPDEELRMYHEGNPNLALKGRIGLAAQLTVEEGDKSTPCFRRWKPFCSPDGVPKIGGKSPMPDEGPDQP